MQGYDGRHVGEYVNATVPELSFGEYWDTCSYSDGVLSYNQDTHRQRTVDWCDATGGTCAAFDFTLKGILQEAVSKKEYWRLVDNQGQPPGVLGMWSSRAITFLENHDTGSTLQHWPFPWENVAEGYAYLLTHPGTPCIFFDHFYYDENLRRDILKLVEIRKKFGINYKAEVVVQKAYNELYAALINKRIAMKVRVCTGYHDLQSMPLYDFLRPFSEILLTSMQIGPGHWSPKDDLSQISNDWRMLHSGKNFAVWEACK
jgi:alpha-amylase